MNNADRVRAAYALINDCSDPLDCECSSDFVHAFNMAKVGLSYLVDVCFSRFDSKSELPKSD